MNESINVNEQLLKELSKLKQENLSLKEELNKFVAERTQIHGAIGASESKYKCLFETANDAIFLMENDVIIDCNLKTLAMFGCTKEQIIGHLTHEFSPEYQPDGSSSVDKGEQYIAQADAGIPQLFEWKHRRIDGTMFDVEVSLNVFIDSDQRLIQAIIRDITQIYETTEILKLNEEEIIRQNSQFTSLLKNLSQGVFMVEAPSGKPILANDAALTLLGRGILPDVTKQNLSEVYKAYRADDRTLYPIDKMPIARGMNGESSYIDDVLIIRPDGTEIFLEIFGTPVTDKNGDVWASLVSFTDITMRKQTEASLRESEARFKTIFLKSPIGISLSDSVTGEIIDANPRFSEIVGRELEDIFTINWMDITHPDDVAVDRQQSLRLLDGEISSYQMEKRFIRPDGSVVWANMTLVSLPEKTHGHPLNLCLNEDITDKKNHELELIKAKEKAEESDRLKSAFLANMSHEIRTPMNGILGFAELLKEPNLSGEEQQVYIQIIQKSGERMLNIINNIVDISKIEAGQMLANVKEININELMENIYSFFNLEVEQKGVQLICEKKLPIDQQIIKTDYDKLHSILTNLIKNAIKFTQHGSIEFGCENKREHLHFFVKDTGMGIPEDRQKAIFERFIQADISDVMARQGAGLGLSISKAYIEILGGKIWLESEEGKGSSFYFTLPL